MNTLREYWYIACRSGDLRGNRPLAVQIMDEPVALFRDRERCAHALPDRCLHRCGLLSSGSVTGDGRLKCPYHGWEYRGDGAVASIPSEGGECAVEGNRRRPSHRPYGVVEQDGYVYVRLAQPSGGQGPAPFTMPDRGRPGWGNIRLVHDFENNVTNCVENFIDVPHTAFVHRGIFRSEANRTIEAEVARAKGEVHVEYQNERDNLGSFSWFLNPKGEPVYHTDSFYPPNITHVHYRVGSGDRIQYLITSQSVPVTAESTRVFTDITYRFGALTRLSRPVAKRQARAVIRQDIDVLRDQMAVIRKHGPKFIDSPADVIHRLVSEVRRELEAGRRPEGLPDEKHTVKFWV